MKHFGERAATTGLFLANGLGIGAWAVAIPRVKERLGLTEAALGLALFAFAGGAIIAMGLAGRMARRFGSGPSTAYLGLAFALLLPLPALVPNPALLGLSLLALGAANGAMDVSMNGHASVLEARAGRPIMSSFHAAFSLGGLLGAALGGAIQGHGLGAGAGLALPDLLIAALVLAGAGVVLRAHPANRTNDLPPAAAGHLVLPSAALLRLAGLAFLCMLVEGAVADWSAVYLRATLAGRAGLAALGYSAFALAMAGCRLVGDRAVRHLGARRVIALGGLLAAAGLALVLGLPTAVSAALGFALVGIGLANVVPVIFSASGRSTAIPAVGVAMAATAGYAGFLVGPPLIGFGAGLIGLRLALTGLLLATLGVGLFGGRALRPRADAGAS